MVTGAEPFTLENPLESAVYEELTCATSTPSVIGVDEDEPEEPEEPEESEESGETEDDPENETEPDGEEDETTPDP